MYRFILFLIIPAIATTLTGCQTMPTSNDSDPVVQAPKADPAAELQTKLGTGYMRAGKYDLAWARLTKALEYDPRYSVAHNAMGLLYEHLNEPVKAEEHFQSAIKYNPRDSSARTNYASFLCRQDRLSDAEVQFTEALKDPLYQSREIPYTNFGLCLHQNGDDKNAETYLRQALALNPRIPSALITMSDLSLNNGQELSARAYMQRYIEVSKHSPQTLWLGVKIERALGDLDAAASYAMQLKANYPDSDETRQLLDAESQWQ